MLAPMEVPVELVRIAEEIVARSWTDEEWAEHESDDEFQTERLIGGYGATESAFCFSVYDNTGSEWCFQLTLAEVAEVAAGNRTRIDVRRPA